MIRRPTPREIAYRWHSEAIRGVFGDDVEYLGEEPQCGWFKRRLVRHGPFVPARIWLDQCIDPETGELVADEAMLCEVDGQWADAEVQWQSLCGNPISEAEYNYLMARRDYATAWAPHEPAANPRQPINWLRVPVPKF